MPAPSDPDATILTDEGLRALIAEARALRRALKPELAVGILTGALRSAPDSVVGLTLLGNTHTDLRQYDEAIAAFDRAIVIAPDGVDAYIGRGLARMRSNRLPGAMADGMRATTLRPDSASAWTALGRIFSAASLGDLAAKAFRKAVALAPDRSAVKGLLLQEQMVSCDWSGLDALVADIEADVAAGYPTVSPFFWHAISSSSESLLQVARQASAARPFDPLPARPRASVASARIKVGYVSGELSTSANALCMAGVFEAHDKDAVDLVAFDNGVDDGSDLRQRIVASFSEMVPVAALSDRELAVAVADRGIDVLVNLNGFFGNDRSTAFRLKPVPIQVNYLGCPGTMGAPYMDYIVADTTVIPEDETRFYDEKIAWMPDSYYPTDRARPISQRVFSRQECGLPADAFVFCCFNTAHKILPDTFASWMRILTRAPGSVLWLIDANPAATRNLRAAAAVHEVDPARLVFARHVSPPDHLARHRCADLFLDTLPYNAHTTTIDALWSGLPVLTCSGRTFPGRVAASALASIGLPDLVTSNSNDFERRAIELASDPDAIERLRERLATNRLTTPLFDTVSFTRHLETAYRTMVDRHRRGLPPVSFAVPRVTATGRSARDLDERRGIA